MTTSTTVEPPQRAGGCRGFGLPNHLSGEQRLPLQIGKVDLVVVDHTKRPDAGSGQIEEQRAAEFHRTDNQDTCRLQPPLANSAELR